MSLTLILSLLVASFFGGILFIAVRQAKKTSALEVEKRYLEREEQVYEEQIDAITDRSREPTNERLREGNF